MESTQDPQGNNLRSAEEKLLWVLSDSLNRPRRVVALCLSSFRGSGMGNRGLLSWPFNAEQKRSACLCMVIKKKTFTVASEHVETPSSPILALAQHLFFCCLKPQGENESVLDVFLLQLQRHPLQCCCLSLFPPSDHGSACCCISVGSHVPQCRNCTWL